MTASLALALTAAAIAYQDYHHYISLGPHGLPNTFAGWLLQLKLTRSAREDVLVPASYDIDQIAGPYDTVSYLPQEGKEALKKRPGRTPWIANYVAPQRQETDQATPSIQSAMSTHLTTLASTHPFLQPQTSVIEGQCPALGIRHYPLSSLPSPTIPILKVYKKTKGEICHIHPQDGSIHCTLSLADQKRVIEVGRA